MALTETSENINYALAISDNDINPDIPYPFFNNNKFDITKLKNYILGFEALALDKRLNSFLKIMVKVYMCRENLLYKPYIKNIYRNYNPFRILIDGFIASHLTMMNIKKNLYNLQTLCDDNVFIFGRIVDNIVNDNCNPFDFEFIDMICQSIEVYDNLCENLRTIYSIHIIEFGNIHLIMLRGVPRMLKIYINANFQSYLIQIPNPLLQIYITTNYKIMKTTNYNNADNNRLCMKSPIISQSTTYFTNLYKQTNNLESCFENLDIMNNVMIDYAKYNSSNTYNSNGHLFY